MAEGTEIETARALVLDANGVATWTTRNVEIYLSAQ